ncbi:MAG: hypothetical protein OEZ13_03260 [Spirochaetia bacterium]|nr:hypothetical protein [Spirochaetia bacterium]
MKKEFLSYLFIYTLFSFSLFSLEETIATNGKNDSEQYLQIKINSGKLVKGKILEETDEYLVLLTNDRLEIKIDKTLISSRTFINKKDTLENSYIKDPNYSRLLFAPTARPLKAGDGYIYDYELFFPGVSYGITDYLGVMSGISIIPGVSLSDQLFYIAPKIGYEFDEIFSLAGGMLYAYVFDAGHLGILYSVVTFGDYDAHFTLGIGGTFVDFKFSADPILVLGGSVRLSKNVALVSENWIHPQLELSEIPFGLAFRFFGENISVDLGVILIGEVLANGFPVPWLSFIYNFKD